MRSDDETSAVQLHLMLVARGYELSLATILRCRTSLGWTFRGSSYCQLIRHANKTKRLQWTIDNRDYNFRLLQAYIQRSTQAWWELFYEGYCMCMCVHLRAVMPLQYKFHSDFETLYNNVLCCLVYLLYFQYVS